MRHEPWTCATCQRANLETNLFCGACGEAKQTTTAPALTARAFVPPWERPGYVPSRPEDPCTEPGCTLTVREHIEQFKRAGDKIIQRVVRL